MGLERSVVLLHPMRDPSNGRGMAVTSSNERSQQRQLRRRDGSYGGEIAATTERWQLLQACDDEDQSSNSDQRNKSIRSMMASCSAGCYLFIFIVQSSGRTGGSTRLLTGFTFINIGSFLSLECSFKKSNKYGFSG